MSCDSLPHAGHTLRPLTSVVPTTPWVSSLYSKSGRWGAEEPSVLNEAAQLGNGGAEIRTQAVWLSRLHAELAAVCSPYTSEDSGRGDGASGLKMLSFVASRPGGLRGSEAIISSLITFQWPGD